MLSILIVDDDPLLCAAMRRKIQIVDQGNGLGVQEVAAAHSVQEAWDLLHSRPINVLISDIQMPYRSGLDLVREVSRSRPEIQLVVLSGYDDYEYMRGALRCGGLSAEAGKAGADPRGAAKMCGKPSLPRGELPAAAAPDGLGGMDKGAA